MSSLLSQSSRQLTPRSSQPVATHSQVPPKPQTSPSAHAHFDVLKSSQLSMQLVPEALQDVTLQVLGAQLPLELQTFPEPQGHKVGS